MKLSKTASVKTQPNGIWDVRDFGAAGDGRHKATQSIQSAINACGFFFVERVAKAVVEETVKAIRELWPETRGRT